MRLQWKGFLLAVMMYPLLNPLASATGAHDPKSVLVLYADRPDLPSHRWGQLRRWRVSEERLPPGSIVRNKELSVWERYKQYIIGSALLCLIEALLMVGLLVQWKQRRLVERGMRESQALSSAVLASLQGLVAVIDRHGKIIAVNGAWSRFARERQAGSSPSVSVGANYLDVCRRAAEANDLSARLEFLLLNLNQVIREVVQLLHSDTLMRHVGITLELDPDLPSVHGDRVQLQQVILNLMLNGFEAMAGQTVQNRTLTVRSQRAGADVVQVGVRDRGSGLDADRIERIFEPFYTTKAEGMGMGLAICRSIIETHGGRFWAVNNPDRGATFSFTLPVSKEEP
jgi:signal transduction histidine kinase